MDRFLQRPLCVTVCAPTRTDVICGLTPCIGAQAVENGARFHACPYSRVSAVPLKQRARTAIPGAWGGTRACGRTADAGRALPVRLCLPAHTRPSRPVGTCVHTRVRRAGWACRRCARVRWMCPTPPRLDHFGCPSSCVSPVPPPRLCGCMRGGGGGGGEQRAPACCAHARVPPRHAGDRPSLYLLQHKHLCIPTAA